MTPLVNGEISDDRELSDTFITKILLGTFGCSPVYERYFYLGLKLSCMLRQFGPTSLIQLAKVYQTNAEFVQYVDVHSKTNGEAREIPNLAAPLVSSKSK